MGKKKGGMAKPGYPEMGAPPPQQMPMQPSAGGQAPPPQMMTPSGQGGFAPPRQMPQQMPMMPPQAQGNAYGRMGQMNPKFQMGRMGMPPPNAAMLMDPYGGDTFQAPPPQANRQRMMQMIQQLRGGMNRG